MKINNLNAYSSTQNSYLLRAKRAVYSCYWLKQQFSLPLGFKGSTWEQSILFRSISQSVCEWHHPTAASPSRERPRPFRQQRRLRHFSRPLHYSLQTTRELCMISITHQGKNMIKEKQRTCFFPWEIPSMQADSSWQVSPYAKGESCRAAGLHFQARPRSGIFMGWGTPLNKPIILLISLSKGLWMSSNGMNSLGADLTCWRFHLGSCKNMAVISIMWHSSSCSASPLRQL